MHRSLYCFNAISHITRPFFLHESAFQLFQVTLYFHMWEQNMCCRPAKYLHYWTGNFNSSLLREDQAHKCLNSLFYIFSLYLCSFYSTCSVITATQYPRYLHMFFFLSIILKTHKPQSSNISSKNLFSAGDGLACKVQMTRFRLATKILIFFQSQPNIMLVCFYCNYNPCFTIRHSTGYLQRCGSE